MVWICLIAQFLDSALPHSPEFIEYTPRKKSAGKRKHQEGHYQGGPWRSYPFLIVPGAFWVLLL